MFVHFRTTENRPVAFNPGYVVCVMPGPDSGTTHIQVSTSAVIRVAEDYSIVLEKMKLGPQDEDDEDNQY